MAPPPNDDPSIEEEEDDYDEAADSDFDLSPTSHPSASSSSSSSSSSSDNEGLPSTNTKTPPRPKKRRKITRFARQKPSSPPPPPPPKLDSGDEATLKEARKTRCKQLKKGEPIASDSDADPDSQTPQGWRAKTRSMREREHEEKKANKLATIKGSTVDVDALWEKLNAPDALKLLSSTHTSPPNSQLEDSQQPLPDRKVLPGPSLANTESLPPLPSTKPAEEEEEEETITITRTYTFAGTTHAESKTVLASSAEAKLYLSQQSSLKPTSQPTAQAKLDSSGRTIHRPLRKTSRFDPNLNNIEFFKGQWSSQTGSGVAGKKGPTGPKLNVVEKSKMDWASHVDAQGLKEELDVAAKAKDNYLQRTDFLKDVEGRRDEEARAARLRGK